MSKHRRIHKKKRRKSPLHGGPVFLGISIVIALVILVFGRARASKSNNTIADSATASPFTESHPATAQPSYPPADDPKTQVTIASQSENLPNPLRMQPDQPGISGLSQLINQRLLDVKSGQIQVIPLRDEWLSLLKQPLNPAQMNELKAALGTLSRYWLWGSKILSGDRLCEIYTVHPGDQLATISRNYQTPWELVAQINGIENPRGLKAWQKLKVVQGPFHAVVHKSSFTLDLYLKETFVRSYGVALARPGKVTPTGLWVVQDRLRAAAWTDPETGRTYQPNHPDYPLGPVWIPLRGLSGDAKDQPSYGIHGTNEPDSIGSASSSGCIRLRNDEAEELYSLLVPGASTIRVID